MNDKIFGLLFRDALESSDRDTFVSDWVMSRVWGDQNHAERVEQLGQIWDVAHIGVADIRCTTGLDRSSFADRFGVRLRTVENWERGKSECAPHIRLLLAMASGCYQHP